MWPLTSLDSLTTNVLYPLFTAFVVIFAGVEIVRFLFSNKHLQISKYTRHSWTTIDSLSRACYCSVCGLLLMDGYYCDCCGVCTDGTCLKIVDKTVKCKALSLLSDSGSMKHHWVKGNLSLSTVCEVCEEDSGSVSGFDFHCCWCQRAVHSKCIEKMGNICDFGAFSNYIVPPINIELSGRRTSVSNRLRISRVKRVESPDWSPVIILANRSSGSNDGGTVLSMFRRVLNPVQVIDLSVFTPEVALEWCSIVSPDVILKFIVAGGDGTIAWVLNAISKAKLKNTPVVGVIPLGTGNDLSRVLGWSKAFSPAENSCATVMANVKRSKVVQLDRWLVNVHPQRHMGLALGSKRMFMYNYISVGVDAQVTLDFHRTRESRFYHKFSSRSFNKVLYMLFGTQQVIEKMYQDLDKHLEVYLDGKLQELPSLESIVVLNIPSWGAGVDLWSMLHEEDCSLPEQSFGDGLLEVLGVYSSFHIAQLQVGLSKPHQIGRAKSVKIKLKTRAAVQVDGEPWLQNPCEVNIDFNSQSSVLQFGKKHE